MAPLQSCYAGREQTAAPDPDLTTTGPSKNRSYLAPANENDSYHLLLIRVDTSGCSGTKMSKVVSATASHTCTDTNGLLTTNL